MKKLTAKQTEILIYIKKFIDTYGFSPTIRDIGKAYDITPNGAYDHVKALENKGKISRNGNGSARSIILTEDIDFIIDNDTVIRNKNYQLIKFKMQKLPKGIKCIICNSSENIDRHHEDYNNPEITIDLCKKHHRKLHVIKNLLNKNGYDFKITSV